MIESFLQHLQYEKRLSRNTVIAYANDLRQLESFLLKNFQESNLTAASYHMIRSWIVSCVERGIQPRSVNRKIACLRSFYKFLLKQEVISIDPTVRIPVLKTSKRLPSFIKESDMTSLLDGDGFENTFEGIRDRLILEMFYGTGLRLSELIGLRNDSIDTANRTVRVLGKRNKERVIPFTAALVPLVKEYIATRNRDVEKKDHGIFFVRANGEPCYPVMIYKIVRKYLDKFPAMQKRSPHVLRHTYATHLLNNGAELNAVKDLLGHTSIAATQVYTHNTTEKLKKVFEQAHPKA
mgnify:CR=1 FL=1|jgi:integrase/recombinase XerC